ncbi:VOC family protein [Nocardioides carbamazepini]|uniref:VOC family protein n=1 Tax=Nocardioides carbamazepini TaxID=2854259 RepID=UPI00214A1865|nr:VOC family protein [Nocardioides carbamazepini]MCR1782439.1 VOC family protein [Nocardioides carbamazepini]
MIGADGGREDTARRGLPGLRRLDHVGFTVPDFAEARRFLEEVLGCEYLYANGPFQDDDGTWMADHLDVHPRATCVLHFFRLGGQAVLEVFEYDAPDQRRSSPANSDVGGHHLALYVDDIDLAIAHLRSHDIRVLGEPTTSGGPSTGQRFVYFLSPWGMQFELVSYPEGKQFFLDEARAKAEWAEAEQALDQG